MKSLYLYYSIKKYIPRTVQINCRHYIARYKRAANFDLWPIDPEAAEPPIGWRGWPENKKFALVLTHDVDTKRGYENTLKLMELEKKLGFRSSFNFVPEGYPISTEIINTLRQSGFDIGVHGLTHEGRLFLKKETFNQCVPQINSYLKKWQSVGFHSPSMLVHLDWISDLDVEYDCSTFDTDPFEPINYAVKTIFPFIVTADKRKHTFVELPYTLPQDHTLFIVLKEKNINIWKKKLAWIAENSGMAFLNTHPDYMIFGNEPSQFECYPADYYEEFLEFIKARYHGQYWNVLPRDLALFVKNNLYELLRPSSHPLKEQMRTRTSKIKGKIWIDLDNSPHVPFFRPIINSLNRKGYKVLITARDNSQTCELADRYLINYFRVGKHYGRNKIIKVIATINRALALAIIMRKRNIKLAVAHGSRAQVLAARFLRIPSLGISDYEYTTGLGSPNWVMYPKVLAETSLINGKIKPLAYPGIKEDVYLPYFEPDLSLRQYLGIRQDDILVTIRPPATEAHYHNPESERLFEAAVNWLRTFDTVRIVILPRYESQLKYLYKKWPEEIRNKKIIIPSEALDGLNLLWNSDLVISGGGTMNREAAALRVPVYSIFRGKIGAVDKWLNEQGRLELITAVEEIPNKIKVKKREIKPQADISETPALSAIIAHIENLISNNNRRKTSL